MKFLNDIIKQITAFDKLIKKFASLPVVRHILQLDGTTIVILVLLICGVAGGVFYYRKKKKAAAAAADPEAPGETPGPPADGAMDVPRMKPDALSRVWKQFLKNIPGEFRRSILLYQPFVVFGESGTGKSELIGTYTDWKSQANQFYPSYTQDPDLKIYLGSRIVVQEISSALMRDTTLQARNALVNLWKPFSRRGDFTVVLTLRSEDLVGNSPEALKTQAQILRGKLNVLSGIFRRPVTVYIVVTFMEEVAGYTEFASVMQQKGLPIHIRIDTEEDFARLADYPERYETYLSTLLVSESANDYLKIVAFLRTVPEYLSGLVRFINILRKPDPLSAVPVVRRIYPTSTVVPDQILSNPFEGDIPIQAIRKHHPQRVQRIIAGGVALVGIVYLLVSYGYKHNLIRSVYDGIGSDTDRITMSFRQTGGASGGDAVMDLIQKASVIGGDTTLSYLADFFPEAGPAITSHVLFTIRNQVFLPKLKRYLGNPDDHERSILLLSLLYASNTNELGRSVLEKPAYWAEQLRLPESFIKTYVSISDTSSNANFVTLTGVSWEDSFFRNHQEFRKQSTGAKGLRPLEVFLTEVSMLQANGFVAPKKLSELQMAAERFLETLNMAFRAALTDKLLRLLATETILPLDGVYQRELRAWNTDYNDLTSLLGGFRDLSLDIPQVSELNLDKLFSLLSVMAKREAKVPASKPVHLNGKPYTVDAEGLDWMVKRSNIILLIREFISYYSGYEGMSFFRKLAVYEDLVVDLSTGDGFFFSSKKTINGKYTRPVYDLEVKPVLEQMPALLSSLPIGTEDKNRLSGFIFRETDAYARNYVAEYEQYYRKFRIKAGSVGELRYILGQMLMPMSQFQAFMVHLSDNLLLSTGDNEYFKPVNTHLRTMGFVRLVMQQQKDLYPELEKYKAILRLISEDLQGLPKADKQEGDKGGDAAPEAPPEGLEPTLSPVGKICLNIFRDDRESYLTLVRRWEQSVGISEEWGYPFIEPVYQAYLLGLTELEQALEESWEALYSTEIKPVVSGYPFNPVSERMTDPETLLNLLHPAGTFRKTVNGSIAPLCRNVNGQWKPRSFSMGSPKFPKGMLDTVNALERLSGLLVDDTGAPKPLMLEVKPHPLPVREKTMPVVVLSYLQSGGSSVFGFNQQPMWYPFEYQWWKKQHAAVGIEFTEGEDDGTVYRTVTVPASNWNLFRLLEKAESPEAGTWCWAIENPGEIIWKRVVTFSIRQNPWTVFPKGLSAPSGKSVGMNGGKR